MQRYAVPKADAPEAEIAAYRRFMEPFEPVEHVHHHDPPTAPITYSEKIHQKMEDGRATPTYSEEAMPRHSSESNGTDSSASHWKDTALRAAVDAANIDLFVTLTRSDDTLAPKTAALNLATAQRLVLANYQRRITESAHKVMTTNADDSAEETLAELDRLLLCYCKLSLH